MSWIISIILNRIVSWLAKLLGKEIAKSAEAASIDADAKAKSDAAIASRDKSDEEFDKAAANQLGPK